MDPWLLRNAVWIATHCGFCLLCVFVIFLLLSKLWLWLVSRVAFAVWMSTTNSLIYHIFVTHGGEINLNWDQIIWKKPGSKSSPSPCRMNQAPTTGFEEDVGAKTTHHLMYPESAKDLDNTTSLVLIPFKTLDLQWILSALTTGTIKQWVRVCVWRVERIRQESSLQSADPTPREKNTSKEWNQSERTATLLKGAAGLSPKSFQHLLSFNISF